MVTYEARLFMQNCGVYSIYCILFCKRLNYSEMLIPTSNYWNVIHGARAGEVIQDEEGVQIMRVLGKNMAWLMKLVENGKGTVAEPERESKIYMNFIH